MSIMSIAEYVHTDDFIDILAEVINKKHPDTDNAEWYLKTYRQEIIEDVALQVEKEMSFDKNDVLAELLSNTSDTDDLIEEAYEVALEMFTDEYIDDNFEEE